ncbi:hypothetical protein BUALT_Bualt04G0119100 [Buddleja alternifolia]|uniref:Retrotransposon Copia-like N-terminal domain-containing protein n=1 Tax=Buddleja alternifolia TaxID=168488 RepID=A0AAV6XZG8_9LAMI|nr:hypothetical protein BUALT_Bualt04G0119100 [Buddleja alternifolia]
MIGRIEPDVNRTRNLLIWSQTRYHCATDPLVTICPTAISGYLSNIEALSGNNYGKWRDQLDILLGVTDLDYALRVDAPAALTSQSTSEEKAAYEKWDRSNCVSLKIIKGSITFDIQGGVEDSDNARIPCLCRRIIPNLI